MPSLHRYCAPFVFLFSCLFVSLPPLSAEDLLKLRDGDRVVLLGSTLIEREQSYAYWETALSTANPQVNFSLRNLGWSGDTVWAESRAGFGTPEDGFKELQKLVETLQPTLIVINYGFNESFAGEQGLPRFKEGLKRLTDMLAATKARLVLVSPTSMERRAGKFPDHTADNRNIALYRDAIRDFANTHHIPFGDWTDSVIPPAGRLTLSAQDALTDNGLHLTNTGYWRTAGSLASLSGVSPPEHKLTIDVAAKTVTGFATAEKFTYNETLSFTGTSKQLPIATGPFDKEPVPYLIVATGLQPGVTYLFELEGSPISSAKGAMWAGGITIPFHHDFEQVEELRATILRKNELFFHRWRPQNVTYLFGFRKHEQGQNAREVAEFEPLVQEQDRLIDGLKRPRPYQYKFVPLPAAQ